MQFALMTLTASTVLVAICAEFMVDERRTGTAADRGRCGRTCYGCYRGMQEQDGSGNWGRCGVELENCGSSVADDCGTRLDDRV